MCSSDLRDHPEMTDMRRGEDKIGGMLGYQIKRAAKIAVNAGSPEAKLMREKRKAYKASHKEFAKTHPYTGNAVYPEEFAKYSKNLYQGD